MSFPLRGRNCFIEDISWEGVELPKGIFCEYADAEHIRIAFRNRLAENLKGFGLEIVDQPKEADIKVTPKIEKFRKNYEKSTFACLLNYFLEFICIPGLVRGSSDWASIRCDIVADGIDLVVYSESDYPGVANILSYRINETLVDFYMDKPEQTG
jgi:hypothetical protein